MFICKLYALLCWRKIKYLSIYLPFSPWSSFSIYHFMCIIVHVVYIFNVSLHVCHFPRGIRRQCNTSCVSFSPWSSLSMFLIMCIIFHVVFIVSVSFLVYHFPRGLHRQCILSCVSFSLWSSSSMCPFMCIIYCGLYRHCFTSCVSFSPWFSSQCIPSPWSSSSMYPFLCIIFPVVFIVNVSLLVYHFPRGFHRQCIPSFASFSPWSSC